VGEDSGGGHPLVAYVCTSMTYWSVFISLNDLSISPLCYWNSVKSG